MEAATMSAIETAIVYGLLLWGCWLAAKCLCEFVETPPEVDT